jgi:hypothetical protein
VVEEGQYVSIVAEDFNGDGKDDLATANSGGPGDPGDLQILINRGDGTFDAPHHVPLGVTRPRDVALGEMNADGLMDILVLSRTGFVSVVLGAGGGTFKEPVNFPIAGFAPVSMTLGDLNGDGNQDVAAANDFPDWSPLVPTVVSVLLAKGDGTFLSGVVSQGLLVSAGASVDVNADGVADLVGVGPGEDELSICHGLGNGTFTVGDTYEVGSGPTSPAIADFNGDGTRDLVTANVGSNDVSVILLNADGSVKSNRRYPVGFRPQRVRTGDLDGDGHEDLATVNFGAGGPGAGDLSVLFGEGDGAFGSDVRLPAGWVPVDLIVEDFDGDGRADIAVANQSSSIIGNVLVLLSMGDRTFAPPAYLGGGSYPSVQTADFNGDGRADLVAPRRGSESVSVFLGIRKGLFAEGRLVTVGPEPYFVSVGDLNGDGNADLAVSTAASLGRPLGISVVLGYGNGDFGPPIRYGATGRTIIGDFTGDRRNDILAARGYADVFVLPNLGSFSAPNAPPTAVAGPDVSTECASPSGAWVTLDGSASTDPDSTAGTNDDIVSYEWFEDMGAPSETFLGSGQSLRLEFSVGTHLVTLRVTDGAGEADTDAVTVRVTDTFPPELSVSLTPALLWPPNHRMVDIEALVSGGTCRPLAAVLESITSSEPDDAVGSGDGRTSDDIQGADVGSIDTQFQLRAERARSGDGRTYTITYRAIDDSGNVGTASSSVFVPHDMGGVTEPMMVAAHKNGTGLVLEWDAISGALFYNAVRGRVSNLRDKLDFIHLGQLTCTAPSATRTSTMGSEDTEFPSPGEAFFYLVEYNDGLASGYGTESAAKERFAPPGQGACPTP